ncbi:MAG TPA: iron-sulfur cluster assembly accessory protein [Coxiellaceae bacterium]|nr:iron-sulfur cluster assembly accessory protein [Coxiellaceae bacterium]
MNDTKPVIQLTDSALQHIREMIDRNDARAFRLSVKQTGCSGYMYRPEVVTSAQKDDIVCKQDDVVIYLDLNSFTKIRGTVIDYTKKNLGQSQLVFHNPNATTLCGCGESFNLKEDSQ